VLFADWIADFSRFARTGCYGLHKKACSFMVINMPSRAKALLLGLFFLSCLHTASGASTNLQPYKVLVFSKTAAFRHACIPNGLAAIQQLAKENYFQVVATEDSTLFTDDSLMQYRAVVFLCTTGDVLDDIQQAAFERYIKAGHGYVGIHSASDTEYTWPWYGGLVGAYFSNHPAIQNARILIEDGVHPSTRFFAGAWARNDEWYNFQTNPRTNVHVLATLDETSYSGGTMGDHPIAWYHAYDGGRAWYTAGGHNPSSYSEPAFVAHLLGGILYAAGTYTEPPNGAIVLFDGKDKAQWTRANGTAPGWTVSDGVLSIVPGTGALRTVQTFEDYQLHLEFRFPSNSPNGTAEGSLANTGVYLQNQFEIQIMESYNRPVSGANESGAIWGYRDPSTNASLPGGTWENLDITFHAAVWSSGVKTQNARVTVCLNGALVQDNVAIPAPTTGGAPPEVPPPGGIDLQDLVGVVQFRNIWLLPVGPLRPPPPTATTLVSAGSAWKYIDDGSNQGTAWRTQGFNDSAWPAGWAQFGYGDGDEGTLVRSNRTDGSRIQTTYFRKMFVVTNGWALTNLTMGLLRDDGAIVYLNGTEVFRSGMTNAAVVYWTNWSAITVGGADEGTFYTTNISPGLLIKGTNLLAVEVHQANNTSTDVSFDLWLTGLAYSPPTIGLGQSANGVKLSWPALPAGFTLESSPLPTPSLLWAPETNGPTSTTNGFNNYSIPVSVSNRLYRLSRPF
jgi:type 1 glutamine amidotransferase